MMEMLLISGGNGVFSSQATMEAAEVQMLSV